MDTKDKAIIWALYLAIAIFLPLNIYGCVIGAIITGIAIKIIDTNFASIIHWMQERTDSRQ